MRKEYAMFNAVSSFLTMLIAALAVTVAYNQLGDSKLASAKAIYKDYLSLAFQNPTFSAASFPIESPRFRKFELDSDEYEKYENYVAFLLFSSEEILQLVGDNEEWRSTLRDQFMYHSLYLDSGAININNYSQILDDIIVEAKNCYEVRRSENVGSDIGEVESISSQDTTECGG